MSESRPISVLYPAVDRELKKQARRHLVVLCAALNIELTAERRAQMDSMDRDALERLLHAIGVQRRWPMESARHCEVSRSSDAALHEDGLDELYASFGIEMTPARRAAMAGANGAK